MVYVISAVAEILALHIRGFDVDGVSGTIAFAIEYSENGNMNN